jgi:hypothetical protein
MLIDIVLDNYSSIHANFFPLEHSCKLGHSFRILQDETNSVMHICSEEEMVSLDLFIYF